MKFPGCGRRLFFGRHPLEALTYTVLMYIIAHCQAKCGSGSVLHLPRMERFW